MAQAENLGATICKQWEVVTESGDSLNPPRFMWHTGTVKAFSKATGFRVCYNNGTIEDVDEVIQE